jgi:hypothetical protein
MSRSLIVSVHIIRLQCVCNCVMKTNVSYRFVVCRQEHHPFSFRFDYLCGCQCVMPYKRIMYTPPLKTNIMFRFRVNTVSVDAACCIGIPSTKRRISESVVRDAQLMPTVIGLFPVSRELLDYFFLLYN